MRKVIAIICMVAVFISTFPTSVFAQEANLQSELREAIEGGEEMKELFPNGVFTLMGTRFSISEDTKTFEIKIARQGGTQGEATVNFKAIDVSTQYGSDYVIELPGLLWNDEIPENPDSKPILEDAIQEETEIKNSDDLGLIAGPPTEEQQKELEKVLEGDVAEENGAVEEPQQQNGQPEQAVEEPQQQEGQPEQTVEEPQQQEGQPEQTVEEPQQQEDQPEQTVEEPQQQEGQPEQTVEEPQEADKNQVAAEAAKKLESRVSGLRSASKILTGKTYNDSDWKELDMRPNEAEILKDNYQDYYDNIPGMETTLTFKEGEYEKSILIKPIDDDLSESEEQFIIVLSNATGGAEVGEFYTGWVNIKDNEVFEDSLYEMEMDKLTVEAGIPQVSVKVKRTKGINTMAYVTVGTAGITAEPDVDYIPTSKKVLFLPGVTEQTFTVDLITTYTEKDKTFAIVIDDTRAVFGKNQTKVTLTKAPGSYQLYQGKAETELAGMEPFSTRLMLDYTAINQSSALEKITPNGAMEGEGQYLVKPEDFTLRYGDNAPKPSNVGTNGMTLNPYNARSSAGVQAPISLSGVKSLEFTWSNTGTGRSWYEHNDWWLFGWHCRKSCGWKTSHDYHSKFVINGPAAAPWNKWANNQYTVVSKKGVFGQYNQSLTVQPWMWSSSNLEYWAWNNGENTDNKVNANGVRLFLQPYTLQIENDSNDTGVMARTVTGLDSNGEPIGTGTPINVGTMKIRNVSRDGGHNVSVSDNQKKVVYRSDVITFEPVFNTDAATNKSYADDVYFWGYKVRDRQGNWKNFEGNVMNLNSQWFRENAAAYQNETQGLYANALLRNSGSNWSIEVRPVFKAKNETFIKLDIDSTKGSIDGFINGTNSRVFAISRFDTLKLKVLTKNNATVYDWYVQNDNKDITINSLGDATTYFNNVNVGSSGNLPTTSSFIENANKVKLDSNNINPAVKTELTYKPTAKFTNIMPSFAVNAITVQENPTSRTKYEAYDLKIISEGKNIRSNFLNDNDGKDFYESEKASKKAYTFQYKLRSTTNAAVPASVEFKLYKDTEDAKAQLVETINLTRDSSGVYSFTLNYWDAKYTGCYATMTINGVEQPVDFMLQSGAFVSLNDERNKAIETGDAFNPIVYDQVTRNDVYTINGYTHSNFNIEWMNATGDLDKNGIISTWEDSLFKDYRMIDRTKTVGDSYYLKASYDMPTVYYNFVKTDPNRDMRAISGNISISDKTFLKQSAVTTTPLSGIEITVAGEQAITDTYGNFKLESNKFEAGKSYSCVYSYQGYKYAGVMMVGQNNIIIDMFKDPDMELTNMKLYEIAQNGGDELKPVNGSISLYDEVDRSYDFEFDLSSSRLAGVTIKEAIIVIRDKDGGLRSEKFKISKVTGTPGSFKTTINPSSMSDTVTETSPTNMDPGDRIFIRPIDNQGAAYPEIATGIRLVQNPEKIKIQVGVDNDSSPIPSVPLFGQMLGKLDFLNTNAGNAKPITDQDKANIKTLTGSNTSKTARTAETDEWKIDETERDLFTLSVGFDKDMMDGWAKAVNDSKSRVNKNAPEFTFNVSLVLVYERKDDGRVYFNQLAIGGEAGFSAAYTLTYITPIGVPVYASFSFSVGIGLEVSLIPKDEDDPPLLDAGTSWKGKVTGEVGITVSVGVGVELGVGVAVLKAYLSGTAEVNFDFTLVDASASVSVSFTATLGIRFFFFSKEYTIISKTWGATSARARMAAQSGLYEPLSGFDKISRDYLENRSAWISHESSRLMRSLMAGDSGSGSVSERAVRENGAYPYPSNKLVNLPNGEMLWVFIDDVSGRRDVNRTGIYYSIIAADGSASEPELIDVDGTLDEAPDVLDLGNGEIIISWSDASHEFSDDVSEIDVLTNMDISTAFFSVKDKRMSTPTEVTKTSGRTETNTSGAAILVGDYCGDTSPRAAYDSETGRILLYYVKTDYYDSTAIDTNIPEGSIDDTGSQISPEDSKLLIGDVVNGFSLITYRFAQKDGSGNWVWNDGNSYTSDETANISAMITDEIIAGRLPSGYDVDNYRGDWYGQRFLDVSQAAEIIETTTTTGGVDFTDETGYTYTTPVVTTVEQVATPREELLEPRVVDTAVASYNGLSLFAYSTDEDRDLSTDKDQEIYLQIYNFSENSFSHPIRLTTDKAKVNGVDREEVKDSQPRFVRTNGITYLFWNRNGSIAYMDISGLVKYGLKKIDLGEKSPGVKYPPVYVIDKDNDNHENAKAGTTMAGIEASTGRWGEIMLAVDKDVNPNPTEQNEATEDSAITSYDVVTSDDGDAYLVWTQHQTVLKDKEDPDKASEPENQIREKQIFAARWQPQTQIERVQLDYIDDHEDKEFEVEGSTGKYQYVYTNGKGFYPNLIIVNGVSQVIDYASTPDVNGFIGGAKAGDPIIKQIYKPTDKAGWSKPIQITTALGANYDELGVAALRGNTGIKVAFIRYVQELDGKVFKQNLENRKLGLLTFSPATGVEFTNSSISFGREKPQAGEKVAVNALAKNTGINPIRDTRVEFYQIINGEETLLDTKFIGTYSWEEVTSESAIKGIKSTLVGGDEFNAQILYELPENNGDVSIKAVLKYVDSDGLEQSFVAQKAFTFEAVPEISDLRYEFTGIGKIILDGTITNAGNKDDTLNVEVSVADNTIDFVPVTLKQGESSYFSREIEIPDSYFSEVEAEDGQPIQGIKEIAQLKVGVGAIKDEIAVVRSAPSRALEVMSEVTDFSIDNMNVQKGTTDKIKHNISYKGAVDGEKAALRDEMVVKYISTNPNVARVGADGTIYALAEGTAKVQAVLMPATTISVATKGTLVEDEIAPLAQQLTSPATLPSSILRIKEFNVRVYTGSTPPAPSTPSTPEPTPKPVVPEIQENNKISTSAEVDVLVKDGDAVAKIDDKVIEKLIEESAKATEKIKAEDKDTVVTQILVLKLQNTSGSTSTDVQLSKASLEKLAAVEKLELQIVSDVADTKLDSKALNAIAQSKEVSSEIAIIIEKTDAQSVLQSNANKAAELKPILENRPVYNLEVISNGKSVKSFGEGYARVTVPYALKANENPFSIVVYGISETGEREVLRGHYDSESNTVNLALPTAGIFVLGYNKVDFKDVVDGQWYSNAVNFIAARGITSGIDKDVFGLEQSVTRGQFITMLSKAYGIKPMTGDNFSDVKPGSYYEGYAAAAKQLGISSGVGNNKFDPEKEISRQEMMVLFYNYLKATNQLPEGSGKKASDFSDVQDVAPWALEGINYFTSNGILTGSNNNIRPTGISKRSEFAQILYNLLIRFTR